MRLPRERENIHAGHLWESNSEYDIDINKLISGYDKDYDYDIKLTANNKPEYADKNIHFNLSHTGDYVVCAISENAVGVDIEHTRKNYLKVARRFLLIMNVGGLAKMRTVFLEYGH